MVKKTVPKKSAKKRKTEKDIEDELEETEPISGENNEDSLSGEDVENLTVPEKKKKKKRKPKKPAEQEDEPNKSSAQPANKKQKTQSATPAEADGNEDGDDREIDHEDFQSFGLDDRILKSINELGWERPTLIQDRFIPLALEGKDVLARARTGSGKTAAFTIPILQRILEQKQASGKRGIRALILTPTKELSRQVFNHVCQLSASLCREITAVDLAAQSDPASQRTLLKDLPDIIVGTPSRILSHLENGNMSIKKSLEFLVVDEADLVFSFGYEKEANEIVKHLPVVYQAFLTSATLSDEVKTLKKLLLHNAVTLKLEEAQLPDSTQLTQYHIRCPEEDKFVLIYALLKLKLIRGKTIVFVSSTDRSYRLKLFLQQFGIRSCVLNSELPVNSRCHIVDQFNQGAYQYVIAADESKFEEGIEEAGAAAAKEGDDADGEEAGGAASTSKAPLTADDSGVNKTAGNEKKRKFKGDKESGVSRGIDFEQVANVINFDFPTSVETYIHRVGRTARGWNEGTALSLATDEEYPHLEDVAAVLSEQIGPDAFKPYKFRMEELDGFRYRARDVLRAVTSSAVREARLEEIKREIMSSKRLKSYFTANPKDLRLLRHDSSTHGVRLQEHLKDVPEYIVPPTLRGGNYSSYRRKGRRVGKKWTANPNKKYVQRRKDPLSSFDATE